MNAAFIPVRGGSKSIPLKNIKPICGKPLVYWTVRAACECSRIDAVYVASDSGIIRKAVMDIKCSGTIRNSEKIRVIERSVENASDIASTESAMLEFAEKYKFDNIVLIQATSPLLTSEELSDGFDVFDRKNADSVLSAVRQKRFIWKNDPEGNAYSVNYDVFNRPRRQDFEGYYVENGAFYITSRELLLKSGSRLSGNIMISEMNEDSFLEIDEPSDWLIIENILKNRESRNFQIPKIRMFLTDCDGCLTDGGMYYSENGDEMKKFCTLDGMGFELLRRSGIVTGIITGESVTLNKRRAEKIKADIIEIGCKNKAETVRRLCEKMNIGLCETAYVGDDLNDLEVMSMVGFGCAVRNAVSDLKNMAGYVTQREGGKGAVREVIDLILKNNLG